MKVGEPSEETSKPPQPEPEDEPPEELLRGGPNPDYNPSITTVLAHPDRFHGKKIQIQGFIHIEFEGDAIYLTKDHADYRIYENSLWVRFNKKVVPFEGAGPKQFDRKYVLIEGTFKKGPTGHLGGWPGAIEDIDRIYELRKSN